VLHFLQARVIHITNQPFRRFSKVSDFEEAENFGLALLITALLIKMG